MKNQRITVPLVIPAELRFEEFAPYLSALAAWTSKNHDNLHSLFLDYIEETKGDDTAHSRIKFISFMFLECKAGSELLADLQRWRNAPEVSRRHTNLSVAQ